MADGRELSEKIGLQRLAWLEPIAMMLNYCLDNIITNIHIEETGDPLSRIVHIFVNEEVDKTFHKSLREMIKSGAEENDCYIPSCSFRKREVMFEVFVKYQHHGGFKKHVNRRDG